VVRALAAFVKAGILIGCDAFDGELDDGKAGE